MSNSLKEKRNSLMKEFSRNKPEFLIGKNFVCYLMFLLVTSRIGSEYWGNAIILRVQIRDDLVDLTITDGFNWRELTIMYKNDDRTFVSLQEKNILLQEYWRRFTR